MAIPNGYPMMYGEPLSLEWNGWRSDTRTLAAHGWEVSAHEDPSRMMLSIALRFQHGVYPIYGVSQPAEFDYHKRLYHTWYGRDRRHGEEFQVKMDLAHNIQFRVANLPVFTAVDPYPSMAVHAERIDDIHNLSWFKQLPQETSDIIVAPPTFTELLDQALEIQAPKQKRLREKARGQVQGVIRVAC